MYWLQAEGNNVRPYLHTPRSPHVHALTPPQMFEGYYDVPTYNDKMGFHDGAQNDIFQDAYISSLGPGSATATPNARREVPVAAPTPNPARVVKKHKRTMALAGHGSF